MTDKEPNKESQLDEIEREAAIALKDGNMVQADEIVLDGLDCHLFLKDGEIYEMRRDLEAAHQANTEISKHNQELSKENERLSKTIRSGWDELSKENERARQLIDELQQEVQIHHKDYDPIALDKRIVKLKEQLKAS